MLRIERGRLKNPEIFGNLSLSYGQQVNTTAVANAGTVGLDRNNISVLSENGVNINLGVGYTLPVVDNIELSLFGRFELDFETEIGQFFSAGLGVT